MKKSTGVLTAVAVAVIAYVGTTWYVGKQAQQTIETAVAQANIRMANAMVSQPAVHGAKLTVAEYRRHIFSSDVVYSLQLLDEAGQTQEFLLSDHLQHGPFPPAAVMDGNIAPMLGFSRARLLPSATAQEWFDSLDGKSPLTAVTTVRFGGSATSEWLFEPLNITEDDETLTFSGGKVQAQFDNNFADSHITGGFDLLDYSMESTDRIAINGITFEYEAASGADTMRMKANTRAAGLVLESSGEEALAFQNAVMHVSSDLAGDLASGSVRYDFEQVRSGGVDLGSMSVGASGRDFSMTALTALAEVYDELSIRHGSDSENWQLSPDEAARLQDKLLALLATTPVVVLDPVVWTNSQGESRAKVTLQLMRPTLEEAVPFDVLLQQVVRTLDVELKIEKAMFVETLARLQASGQDADTTGLSEALYDEYANRLQTAGLAALTDSAVTIQISYQDGQVNIDGKTMAVPEFMQRALMAVLM